MRPDAMMPASPPVLFGILLLLYGAAPLMGQSAGGLTGNEYYEPWDVIGFRATR